MKTPARRRSTSRFNYLILLGILLIAAVGLAIPAVHSSSTAEPSAGDKASPRSLSAARVPGYGNWLPGLAPAALAGETIEIFAADCTTPKTAFAAGETICAKTNGVDVSAGNYHVNWHHPDNTQTNGGTITVNPQYSLFSIPTSGSYLGTWKANIGRVTPAESSIIGNPPTFTVSAAPTIATFAYALGACTNTPKTNFVIGETVCARSVGINPQDNRRFAWVDADGITREFTPITTDPATDDYALLLTETSIGTWKANVVSSRSTTVVGTRFTVAALTPSVDLSIGKALASAELKSGEDATFTISVYNRGPNDAQNVVITDQTPANATFVAPVTQTVGSGFSCTGATTVTCTAAVMKPGELAVFEFVYTPGTAGLTITNTATVTSDTPEVVAGEDTDGDTIDDASEDNSATAGPYTISPGSGGGGDCELTCPNTITATANTTENGERGAHVNYAAAQSTGTCGTITYSHDSGSFFPVGDTAVTATSATGGGSCTFTIRVEEAGNTSISCPANKTADAGANCDAQVDPGTPTATGTNVTISGVRSDGQPLNARYPVGITTITWTATSHDAQGGETGNASCTQTIEVTGAEDTTPPTVTAPADSSASADSNCQAAIPDYAAGSTTSDNCGSTPTLTQSPEAGTLVGTGPHTVTVTATDDAGNQSSDDVVFTVNDTTAPAIDCPDNIVTTTDAGVCSAAVNPGTATASDNCDTSVAITGTRSDSQPLNAAYPKGTTTITWRATDDAGNYSECQQTVTVNDEEPPTITCQANITVYVAPNSTDTSAVVNYTTPVGQDNCSGATTTQEAGLSSGSSFPVGTTTNTFRVTDASGNYAECTFTVTVLYNFTGFFSPVSNLPAFNNVNAGRTIPLKFSLSGDKGLSIFADGYPVSQQIACDSSAPLSELEGTVTSGGSTLTYSPDTYHYNWKTEASWAGTCRILIVKLNDGTEHTALFKFK